MLSETLKSINNEKKIDLILYSGDMLNTGGSSYDSIGLSLIHIVNKATAPNINKNFFIITRMSFLPQPQIRRVNECRKREAINLFYTTGSGKTLN